MKKRFFWMMCLLLAVCCGAALAAGTTEYSLGEVYATVTLSDSYIVLRPDNLSQHPELLASRSTTVEATLADWEARNVLLQAWVPDLDACLEIRARQDEDAKAWFDMDAQTTQARSVYRNDHMNDEELKSLGYTITEASWTKNGSGVRFLRMRYKRDVNGLITRGYMDQTVKNGWTVTLDYQVLGRGLREKDLNSLKKVLKTISFTQSLPVPSTTRGTLSFTVEPPQETNVSSFTVEGLATPGAHLIGTLMKQANSATTPRRIETDANAKSGKFKLPVKMDAEGVWLLTLTVEKDGNEIAWHVFEPTTYKATLLPLTLDTEVPEQFVGDEFVLSGKTSKAVSIQCIVSGGAKPYDKQVRTNNSGKFSFKIPTDNQSEYTITLVLQKKKFETRRFTWTANRTLTELDIQNQYKAQAVKPAYSTLVRKIDAYNGRIMGYGVTISGIQQAGEEYIITAALTKTKKGVLKDLVVIITQEEPNFVVSSEQTFYGRLNGLYEVQSEEGTETYPSFELLFWD